MEAISTILIIDCQIVDELFSLFWSKLSHLTFE